MFHSFRHSLADRLKQAGVQDTLISEILGHTVESVTMGRYGKRYQPRCSWKPYYSWTMEFDLPVWNMYEQDSL